MKVIEKKLLVVEKELKTPSGKPNGLRSYALSSVEYRKAYGRVTVDVHRSTVYMWSGIYTAVQLASLLKEQGFTVSVWG